MTRRSTDQPSTACLEAMAPLGDSYRPVLQFDHHRVLLHAADLSHDSPDGLNLVSQLQIRHQLLLLAGPLALGPDEQKIEEQKEPAEDQPREDRAFLPTLERKSLPTTPVSVRLKAIRLACRAHHGKLSALRTADRTR